MSGGILNLINNPEALEKLVKDCGNNGKIIPAAVTPFDSETKEVDLVSFENHLNWLTDDKPFVIEYKGKEIVIDPTILSALSIVGTTGESPTLEIDEHIKTIKDFSEIIEKVTEEDIMNIPGTGGNNTKEAIKLSLGAQQYNPTCLLVVTPYYNKPGQEELYGYYADIVENVETPIIIYNVPGRTNVNILPETVQALVTAYGTDKIAGIKEANGDYNTWVELLKIKKDNPNFLVLSGDDSTFFDFVNSVNNNPYFKGQEREFSGDGIITVAGNAFYNLFNEGMRLAKEGIYTSDSENVVPVRNAIRVINHLLWSKETNKGNPQSLKYILNRLTQDWRNPLSNTVRTPLRAVGEHVEGRPIIPVPEQYKVFDGAITRNYINLDEVLKIIPIK